MSKEKFLSTLKLANKLGIQDIRFTGGEPTIHPFFFEFVDIAVNQGFKVGLVTNGIKLIKVGKLAYEMIDKLSRCWISLYAVDAKKHLQIGGKASLRHERILDYLHELPFRRENIGVSVVIHPGEFNIVEAFIDECISKKIQKIRFIPWQPDGRGLEIYKGIDFSQYFEELKQIYQLIRIKGAENKLLQLTINDPIDFASRYHQSCNSCLLHQRKMWSVTPNGNIYSCCFNAYDDTQHVGKLNELNIVTKLNKVRLSEVVSTCRGLKPDFWSSSINEMVTCPISAQGLQ